MGGEQAKVEETEHGLTAAEPGWFDKPMRWAQLNSTEDDVVEMDIGFWMDYFRWIHADALCITAGGVALDTIIATQKM